MSIVKMVASRGSALALGFCAVTLACASKTHEFSNNPGSAGEGGSGAADSAGGAPAGGEGQGGTAAPSRAGETNQGGAGETGMAGANAAGAAGAPNPMSLSLLAGALGGCGTADGVGADARFCSPNSIAWDGAANAYVAEFDRIRKVALVNGTVSTTQLAPGEHATVIAVDPSGQTLFAAMPDYTLRKIDVASRHETVLAGETLVAGTSNGKGALAHFSSVSGLLVGGAGELFVLDAQTIRRVDADGTVSTLAGHPGALASANGTGAAASFLAPRGFALQGTALYVSDATAIRSVDTGSGLVDTIAGSLTEAGSVDAKGSLARFSKPAAIAVQGCCALFVGDGNAVRRVVTTSGDVTTPVGQAAISELHDGTGTAAHFRGLGAMMFDGAASLFALDSGTLRKITVSSSEVTTLAGAPDQHGDVDGVGGDARFYQPAGIAVDAVGTLFVADSRNRLIRQLDPNTKHVTTLAGNIGIGVGGDKDGTGAAAGFDLPLKGGYAAAGVATDADGHVFVVDSQGQTVRQIVASTAEVTTLAGSPNAKGPDDATGAAARFTWPSGVTSDGAGNLFIVDTSGSSIRKLVVATKAVTTLAGGKVGSGDGLGAQAGFNLSCNSGGVSAFAGIAADRAGSLYVADCGNSTIRKVDAKTGDVTTLTGSAGVQNDVDGPLNLARFHTPSGIAFDHDRLYVTDPGNGTLRRITLESGRVDTLVGKPSQLGVVLGALPGGLNRPTGVAVLASGDVVIADAGENALLLLH